MKNVRDMTEDEIDSEIEDIQMEFYCEAERVNLRLEELGYGVLFRVLMMDADQFKRELGAKGGITLKRFVTGHEYSAENLTGHSAERSARLRRSRFHIVPSRGQS